MSARVPAPRLRATRASHDSQYTRYMSYSDALKNSFFPRTIPMWNSLPSSVVASKTTEGIQGSYLEPRVQGIRFSMPLSRFLQIVLMAHPECFPHFAKFKI